MKPKKRQKLCHNCEGEIDIDVIVCPFCAADLREEKPEQKFSSYVSNMQPSNVSPTVHPLYPNPRGPVREEVVSRSVKEEVVSDDADVDAFQDQSGEEKNSGVFAPTILFTLGVQLFIFGLLMLLFSHKGVVILKWDARFWFFYVFASVPFLVFGYKTLSKL